MTSPEDFDRLVASPAAYVHIPFCSAVCPYCDFAVVAGSDEMATDYIGAVVEEIAMSEPIGALGSVYFGGGTPSHIEPGLLGSILDALAGRHGIASDAEVSLEANPEDFSKEQAQVTRSLGFNRVSFGAQSFDAAVLAGLGRRHGATDIASAAGSARESGFENVSLDLIFGSADETPSSWGGSIAGAVAIQPDHLSCYSLTVEPGTPLAKSVANGAPAPDPDTQADRYEYASAKLAASGYERYEVSNWARPGFECRYNMTVWAQGQYEAYGNGAHRFVGRVRSRNVRRLSAYVDRVKSGHRPVSGSDVVEGWDAEIDRLFVGLRRSIGVAPGPGVEALLASDEGRRLQEADVIRLQGERLVVIRPLLTDAVHRAVLALAGP